jgi:hypothetical protein
LTEPITAIPDVGRTADADGLYVVVSHTGNDYLVDSRTGACECPDARHRDPDGGCKHVRRVRYATGETPIPAWVDVDAVDACLSAGVDATPRVVATDGGRQSLKEDTEDVDAEERPDDCDCADWNSDVDLPCWPCYAEGFRTVASTDE